MFELLQLQTLDRSAAISVVVCCLSFFIIVKVTATRAVYLKGGVWY